MIKHALATTLVLATLSAAAVAQEKPAPGEKKTEPAAAQQAPRTPAQLANVRIELTITEQRGGSALPSKTVSMLVADREYGRVRTEQSNAMVNVDARPEILANGRVRVTLSLEYRRLAEESEKMSPPRLIESLSSIVEDGKAQTVSQSADPGGAPGSVRVDLKATISR